MNIEHVNYSDATRCFVSAKVEGVHYSGIRVLDIQNRGGEIACFLSDYLEAGGVVGPYVPPVPTESDYAAAIQSFVDETAKAKGYANGGTLSGYVASSVDAWASEAATFIAWRDAVWLYAYAELAKVQSGQRQQPTIQELMAELIPINWTA